MDGYAVLTSLIALFFAISARKRAEVNKAERESLGFRVDSLRGQIDLLKRELGRRPAVDEAGPASVPPTVADNVEVIPDKPPAASAVPPVFVAPESNPHFDLTVQPLAASASSGDAAPAAEWSTPVRPQSPDQPQSKPGWEERMAKRLPIWLGALALALAGGFLVKYTSEQGLLGPAARTGAALLFGATLVGSGRWAHTRNPNIAQALSASGVAVLYAGLLAASHLYNLVPLWLGFGGMILVTVMAILLSLKQGPLIASLGLVGGFLAPLLIGVREQHPATLFSYLLILQVGLITVSRKRRWSHLSALTLLASLMWCACWVLWLVQGQPTPWLGVFMLSTAGVFVGFAMVSPEVREDGSVGVFRALAYLAIIASQLLLASLTHLSSFEPTEWAMFGVLALGCIILARVDSRYHGMAWLAALMTAALLLDWSVHVATEDHGAYLMYCVVFGGLFYMAGFAALWGKTQARSWAVLSAGAVVAFLALAWLALSRPGQDLEWASAAAGLGVLLAVAAAVTHWLRDRLETPDDVVSAYVFGAAIAFATSLWWVLPWHTVALGWAFEALLLTFVVEKVRVPVLRVAVIVLGGFATLAALGAAGELASQSWFSVVAFMGGSCGLLAFASWRLRTGKREALEPLLAWESMVLAFATISTAVNAVCANVSAISHSVALACAWFLLGGSLLAIGQKRRPSVLATGGSIGLWMALLGYGLVVVGLLNPLQSSISVGSTPVVNWLLVWYGLPLALIVGVAFLARRDQGNLGKFATTFALALVFVLLSLEVRHAFHGSHLNVRSVGSGELYAYSAAWIAYGTGLLLAAIRTRSTALRFASLVVMLAAVGKVFLIDTSELRGLFRVFSLMGLGVSLLALAYLYQRFVFKRAEQVPG